MNTNFRILRYCMATNALMTKSSFNTGVVPIPKYNQLPKRFIRNVILAGCDERGTIRTLIGIGCSDISHSATASLR